MLEKLFITTFPGFISLRDANHKIIYINKNFRDWIGKYTDVEPIGKTNIELAALVSDNVASAFLQCHDSSIDLQNSDPSTAMIKKVIKFEDKEKNFENTQFLDTIKHRVIIKNEPHIFTISYDITSLYKENQSNLYSALTDYMTGAFNRRYLTENKDLFFGHYIAIIDLDNFKMVNDYEGHLVGDIILKRFVQFIKKNIHGVTTVIRIGGDEFLAVFSNAFEEEKILEILENSRNLFEKTYSEYEYLSFSYGVELLGHSIERTLVALDKKMYKDKLERKSRKLNNE
ncbi:GGDEF domain-containing protein [Fusobacterium sp.]|uniref:GGDEF domain-containing protein n=1 Tax=Fusobacterium sp. TaxID=68766 RepID=UPI0029014D00|nr:GGDEF domain-containing protein [Fusobacterium sp.]MDU1910434.1 GGDEF domain-containing protein [Fusobacterium sp.]